MTEKIILLADDEEMVRTVTRMALERAGFRVLLAADGDEAVRLFEENEQRIGGVVLDLTMPRRSGQEVLAIIHRHRPEVPVFLSTGHSEADMAEQLAESPHVHFVGKPFAPKALVERLSQHVGSPTA